MSKNIKSFILAICICCSSVTALTEPVTSSYALTIIAYVTEVSVSKDTIAIDESVQLETEWSTGAKQEIFYSSSDENIAVVDENGLVTGISDGTVTITLSHSNMGKDKTIDITVSSDVEKSIVYNTSELTLGTKLHKYDTLHYDNKNKGSCANIVNTKGSYDIAFINEEDYVLPFDAELVGIDGLVIYLAPDIDGITYLDGRTLNAGDTIDRNIHLLCYDYYIKSTDNSNRMVYPVFLPKYYSEHIGDGEIKVSSINHETKTIELKSVEVIKGDLNSDGELNIFDAVLLRKWLFNTSDIEILDLNSADLCCDGKLNVFDFQLMKKELLSDNQDVTEEKSIITGVRNGMTKDEVFAVLGKDYIAEEEKLSQKYSYYYPVKAGEVFDTALEGEMFVEFDLETGLLVNYGYSLGHLETMNGIIYPYSEQQLKEAYDKIYSVMTDWYGEGTKGSLTSAGSKSEYIWETQNGQIWAIYGVNLWNDEEPETYEKGVNKLIISCSVEN